MTVKNGVVNSKIKTIFILLIIVLSQTPIIKAMDGGAQFIQKKMGLALVQQPDNFPQFFKQFSDLDEQQKKLILNQPVPISTPAWTLLQLACFLGRVDKAKQLIEAGSDVNAKGADKMNALCLAVKAKGLKAKDQENLVIFLLDNKADVNQQIGNGEIALHSAAGYGYADIVRTLLKAGSKPAIMSTATGPKDPGMNPLHEVARGNPPEHGVDTVDVFMLVTGRIILEHCQENKIAIVDSLNSEGKTALHLALENKRKEFAKMLVQEFDATVDEKALTLAKDNFDEKFAQELKQLAEKAKAKKETKKDEPAEAPKSVTEALTVSLQMAFESLNTLLQSLQKIVPTAKI